MGLYGVAIIKKNDCIRHSFFMEVEAKTCAIQVTSKFEKEKVMEEKILKCLDVTGKTEKLISRGYEDEGDILVKSINANSTICIDKETGIVADITNDGVSCEGLAEIVELNNSGLLESQQESEEVVDEAKQTAENAETGETIN